MAVQRVVSVAANYTATCDDEVILVDASVGSRTITLPPASLATRRRICVKKIDTSTTNTVTIDGNGAETIDGATTFVLAGERTSVKLVCDGSGWRRI